MVRGREAQGRRTIAHDSLSGVAHTTHVHMQRQRRVCALNCMHMCMRIRILICMLIRMHLQAGLRAHFAHTGTPLSKLASATPLNMSVNVPTTFTKKTTIAMAWGFLIPNCA